MKLVDEGPDGTLARIQAATGRFLWGRPFQTQTLHSVRQVTEKNVIHGWAGCAGLCRLRGGGGGEPASFSASEAANDRLSSNSPLSLPPNETRSLAAAEGCWSGRVKRTGEISQWGESEERGFTAAESSLISRC